jgi:O-antigen/teichoic acid export membrane protein
LAGAGGAAPLLGLGLAPLAALPFVLPGELRQARGGGFERARVKTYAQYGYPIAATLALTVVLTSTDRFLLAAFMDEAAVGAYHAGYSIANRTLDVLFLWLGSAGQPALVMALERGGADRLKAAAREQLSTFLLIGLPAAAGVALVARPLAEVLIGEDLRTAAAAITPWIALSALLYGLTAYYFGQAFTLGRKTKHLLAAMAVPAVANVILNLILVPRFGVLGAAWATAASFGLGLLTTLALGRRVLALPIAWDSLVRCAMATGIMALAVAALPPIGGFAELMLDATVGAGVYAIAALILNAAGVRDVANRLLERARTRKAAA